MNSQNKAIQITENVFKKLKLEPGKSELYYARWIKNEMKREGAEKEAFSIIVASGKRSALVHGHASRKKIDPGDVVMLDFGASYKGYKADLTRTYFLNKPTKLQKKIYELVLKAQKAAIKKIKAGVKCKEVDNAARKAIADSGFGKFFVHTTGHGVGKRIHQPPKISMRNNNILLEGQVITIEPGIYLKKWGIRIEDMVKVTKNGCKVLTRVPK
ncbi:MAG: Xaa-Pro aminopeptidase [Candidatus Saganbacteria bacterium]|uniref:Xaa-Pro aminopeptidase n=1 Tax=Candidatus Saganbacteria bacterium TaxID=2575572 RepID=A0A833NWG8_UNCSA|nr:MAG: Xaa-Pro aminopeptidase [Candidatus Saganbacteria bacterium]